MIECHLRVILHGAVLGTHFMHQPWAAVISQHPHFWVIAGIWVPKKIRFITLLREQMENPNPRTFKDVAGHMWLVGPYNMIRCGHDITLKYRMCYIFHEIIQYAIYNLWDALNLYKT